MRATTIALLLAGMALIVPGVRADDAIRHYNIQAEIAPERGWLRAHVVMTVTAGDDGLGRIEAVLNRGLLIQSAACPLGIKGVRFDRSEPSTYRYAPIAAPLRVELDRPLRPGESTELALDYEGTLEPHPWGVNTLQANWVELGLYAAWFPYDPTSIRFTSDVRLKIDEGFAVTGSGVVERSGSGWLLTQSRPTDDIVVVAARDLKARTAGTKGLTIELWHTGLDDDLAQGIAQDISGVVETFEGWFGPASARRLTVVFARRDRGGAYARPGFLSLLYDPKTHDRRGLLKQVAHEVAHFWWYRASTTTWEDWLNESVAEYSALLLLGSRFGEAALAEELTTYEQPAAEAPPIWGLDRDDDQTYAALYRKGPLLLRRLERALGRPQLLEVMARVSQGQVAETEGFLATLESLTSRTVSDDFEASLKQ